MTENVYLIDASIYVFRGWFTVPDYIVNRDNEPINAVHGFIDFVYQFLHQTRAEYVGFAFDEGSTSSFRRELYPPYKANREPTPEELKRQFDHCRQFLRAMGLFETGNSRYEADDLIGTLARRMRDRGHKITILTSDKDLTQLIVEDDVWWDFAKGNRHSVEQIKKQFGVYPEQIADQLAVAGDKSDNIPGVPGIGMTTAAKLLDRFSSLEKLLENRAEIGHMKIRGAARIQRLIEDHREQLLLYKKLTTIDCNVNFSNPVQLQRRPPDFARLRTLFDEFYFGHYRRNRWLDLLRA